MELRNRSILLTGGGSGIGRSLALHLADHTPRLTLVGRRRGRLEEVAELVRARGGQAHVVPADVTGAGAAADVVAATQEQFGGIDILVNNAGNVRAGRLEAIDETEVVTQIALNLTAPILLTRAALPALRASGDGLVVNVSSGIALIVRPHHRAGCAAARRAARRLLTVLLRPGGPSGEPDQRAERARS
jgi:uncharacterized oxidoreductase